jgi:hypothetical protein
MKWPRDRIVYRVFGRSNCFKGWSNYSILWTSKGDSIAGINTTNSVYSLENERGRSISRTKVVLLTESTSIQAVYSLACWPEQLIRNDRVQISCLNTLKRDFDSESLGLGCGIAALHFPFATIVYWILRSWKPRTRASSSFIVRGRYLVGLVSTPTLFHQVHSPDDFVR